MTKLFNLPFSELIDKAHQIHKKNFDPKKIQLSTLLNIKTGNCPEDCKYCSQSRHYKTNLKTEPLMDVASVLDKAKKAKAIGAERFCMGASGRGPSHEEIDKVSEMIVEIKKLGLETCITLGLLKDGQAEKLKAAGLDFYNHNIDTCKEYYKEIITTRKYEDRIDTLSKVKKAGINTCCGGIIGLGETREQRYQMIEELKIINPPSVPINMLVPIPGTPHANTSLIDPFEVIKTIAVVRISLPKSYIRLSAGRESLSDEAQALCFFAGANSIFYGEMLLTTKNPIPKRDVDLFNKLGLKPINYNLKDFNEPTTARNTTKNQPNE